MRRRPELRCFSYVGDSLENLHMEVNLILAVVDICNYSLTAPMLSLLNCYITTIYMLIVSNHVFFQFQIDVEKNILIPRLN